MSESEQSQAFQLPKPGPEHNLLKPLEGSFKAVVKMQMGPGEPMVSTGTMNNSFHLGGLYLYQDYKGDPSGESLPQFEGRGYWGFNTTTGQYEAFWIDSASTTMGIEQGSVDESGKIFEMKSEFIAPGGSAKMQKRSVITVVDDDHHQMQTFITPAGSDEMLHMEIDYQRV